MAAELVGGAVLSSFLQVAFDRLASREILHYFKHRGLDETLVNKLKIMLLSINTVIDDAEDKQFTNSNVKAWLSELKDAVSDAEDVLDEINYELYKHKQEQEAEAETETQLTGVIAQVWKFFHVSASSFDEDIESRLKQVLENLEFLERRKIDLGLKQGKGGAVGSVTKWPTTSLVDEVGIYGRNEDKEIIIRGLLTDSHFSVMSIVGMGGLGKTTLAQLVYNDKRIKSEFDLRIWVCVSDDFDVLRLTKIIFKKIMSSSNDDTEDLDILQNKLKENLSEKKFLIVFDDVWCDDHLSWEALQAPFICGVAGSRILVTSRNESVALAACSDRICRPHQLSDENGWLLFAKYAFRSSYPQTNFDAEEIGRRIVKKCKGLPLALKTIGSLLYRKSSQEEWNNILISEMWNISCKNIFPALILSYHYLPFHLKQCFAYCSLFPKDYEFHKEELVLLWMAQDFFQAPHPNKSIQEVGNECFQELVSRSFFQKSPINTTSFVMHDILNDLANFVSGELCFMQEVKEVTLISEKIRHLSLLTYEWEESGEFEHIGKNSKLQTFLPLMGNHFQIFMRISSDVIFDQLCQCKCLRVLSLGCDLNIMEIPDSIKNLIHLRYLDLSYCEIKRLPESTCLLYNLQTLELVGCRHLDELPRGLHKLKNLCHLDLRNNELKKIPPNLGELKNLEVWLTPFYVGKCGELNIEQLGELNLQGELSLCELQSVVDGMDASKANLKDKRYLERLSFQWNKGRNDDSQNDMNVLEKLQPHRILKELSVKYYGGKLFPGWFADNTLSNVVRLRLESCNHCLVLPSLGLLQSLKSLSITGLDGIVGIGAEFLGSNSCDVSFKSLETLELTNMMNWEEWDCTTASEAFACLKKLHIRKCLKLKATFPQQLPSLEELVIEDCPQLVALVPWAPIIHRLTLRNCEKVRLEYIPSTIKKLNFHGPFANVTLLEKIMPTVNNNYIEEVAISDCPNLELSLNQHHDSLRQIVIERSCGSLRIFTLDLFPALESLYAEGCNSLEKISVSEGRNHVPTSLKTLQIRRCPNFVSLPERMNIFAPSLAIITITDCPQLESFPEGGLPSKLTYLCIVKCPKLFACRMNWGLHNHGFLREFYISDDDVAESLPDPGLLPASITRLLMGGFPNLRMLNYEALCQLPSLKELRLVDCPRLQCLPKEGLPTSLSYIRIAGDCGELKQRCQKLTGQDWPKIAHIPHVSIG